MDVSRDEFDGQRDRRFGRANPERMQLPFWEWMVRGNEDAPPDPADEDEEESPKLGYTPYEARIHFGLQGDYSGGPIWTFQRMGATRTQLPDGRVISIGGEHEDHYDPDFCIYNDVVALGPGREVDIYGYPKEVFPPTDFHSATLAGDRIVVIGRLGYYEERHLGTTPVYALRLTDLRIEELPSRGNLPGWIFKHEASLGPDGLITIRGGEVEEAKGDDSQIRRNFEDFTYDPGTGFWKQVTNRGWRQFSIQDEDRKLFQIGDAATLEYIWSQVRETNPELPNPFINITPDSILPKHIPHEIESEEDWSGARIVIEGTPISIKAEGHTLEIIVEGRMEERLANQLADEIKSSLESHTGRRMVLDRYS